MLVRLSPGTIVTRVLASAARNAYSAARWRICASRGTSDSATPPVRTMSSGFRPFTTAPSIAPRARHASSTTADATASPSRAARKTSGAVIARGSPPAAVSNGASGSPATRARAAGELRHVGHVLADPADGRVDRPGHPDADGLDRVPPALRLLTDGAEQLDDRLRRAPLAVTVGQHALLDEHRALPRDGARGRRRAADVHAEQERVPRHGRSETTEVAERDPERHGGGARRRRADADELGLALARVPALRERVVEHAGVRHELRDAGREVAQPRQGRRESPVRAGARFAEEVVGRPEAGRARAGPRGHILAPYRDAEPLRRGEDDAAHRRVEAHVVVRVEVGRCAFHERQELLDLRPHLALDVLHRRALRRAARVTDESAARVDP